MKMSVQPLFASIMPSDAAADSSVRIEVVPTATTRRPAAFVRYEFCGRVYESQDSIPLGLGRHGTVWVDPAHPSRILPPSWRFRLLLYLAYGAGLIDLLLSL